MISRAAFRSLLVVIVAMASGCATILKGRSQPVLFTSSPPGAKVYVEGELLGVTPLTADVKHGNSRMVLATLPGHVPAMSTLTASVSFLTLTDPFYSLLTGGNRTLDQSAMHLTLEPIVAQAGESTAPKPKAPPWSPVLHTSANDGSRSFALIVGIEKYRESLPQATHAADDAQVFAQLAKTTLGVPPDHIKLLLNERAAKSDIQSAVEEWLPRNAQQPNGTVYVFFSGHGAPEPETGNAYVVPYDADPAYLKTRGYSLQGLYATLAHLHDQRVYVFLDSCFSGSGGRSVLAAGIRPLVPVVVSTMPANVVTLSAAGATQIAGAASSSDHGLFTHYLLVGLAGEADANGDRNVTVGELYRFLKDKVAVEARLQNRVQTPDLQTADGVVADNDTLVKNLRR